MVSKERKFFTPPNWQEPIQTKQQNQAVAVRQNVPTKAAENKAAQTGNSDFKPDFNQKPVQTAAERPPQKLANNDGFKPKFASTAGTAKPSQPVSVKSGSREQMDGYASWYGPGFHGKQTANGEKYNQNQMTAAHRILPMNTWVQVHNLDNNRVAVVRINDRGPYKKNRIIDLTKKAAETLGFKDKGTARVSLKVLQYPRNYDPSKGLDPYKQVVIQVAVFKGEQRAHDFRQQLANRYHNIPFQIDDNKKSVFHVIAGPYKKRAKALEIARSLKADGIDNFVRSYRK